jgi:hypothetical protein
VLSPLIGASPRYCEISLASGDTSIYRSLVEQALKGSVPFFELQRRFMKTPIPFFVILVAACLCSLASTAFALPENAVRLPSNKLFKAGSIQCGKLGNKWVPGTRLNRKGYFISHSQYSKNFRADAANASGNEKKRLLAKAKQLAIKAKKEAPTCSIGGTKLSILGAKTLVVLPLPSPSSVRVSSTTNTLFKVSAEGFMQEVTFTDDAGNSTSTTRNPVGVYDVNQDYIILVFGFDALNLSDGYLVRKGDGKIFSLASAGLPSGFPTNTNFKNGRIVQTDQTGDIFYKVRSTGAGGAGVFDLVKIDTSNPALLTNISYSPTDETIYNFAVNAQGNIIYNSRLKTDLNSEFYRIKKNNGGFQNIPLGSVYWVGIDQNFYYQNSAAVKKLVIDDAGNVTSSDYGVYSFNIPAIYDSYKFDFSDRQVFASTSGARVVEVINPSNNPREVPGLPVAPIRIGGQSNNYYYLAGSDSNSNPTIIRVDPKTDSHVQLYTPGKYDVYEMAVSSDDVVTFSALRLSDGKKVFIKIDSSGNESVINEELNVKAISLVPIN